MNKSSKPMTYARLEDVLIQLGFKKRTTDEFVAFLHEDPESMFVLPHTSASDTISDWHLLSVQKVMSRSTFVSAKRLQRMLNRRTLPKPAAKAEFQEKATTDPDLTAVQ